ncbi:MAG TPA: hypothetical protein VFX28_09935, partial [Methylomirabilota bacterium]|nr:hypothetical protein [Methylomirabilota bacterium]
IKQLGFHEVDCVQVRHLDVAGRPAVYFEPLARLRRGGTADAGQPEVDPMVVPAFVPVTHVNGASGVPAGSNGTHAPAPAETAGLTAPGIDWLVTASRADAPAAPEAIPVVIPAAPATPEPPAGVPPLQLVIPPVAASEEPEPPSHDWLAPLIVEPTALVVEPLLPPLTLESAAPIEPLPPLKPLGSLSVDDKTRMIEPIPVLTLEPAAPAAEPVIAMPTLEMAPIAVPAVEVPALEMAPIAIPAVEVPALETPVAAAPVGTERAAAMPEPTTVETAAKSVTPKRVSFAEAAKELLAAPHGGAAAAGAPAAPAAQGAGAEAPADPAKPVPGLPRGLEGMTFPDGVLTRQWMEFLNQMAAAK